MDRATRRADIARRLGCRVERADPVDVAGVTYAAWNVTCRDNAHAIRLFNELAIDDATYDEGSRAIAAKMRRWAERVPGADVELELARRIHSFVQSTVHFQREEIETLRCVALTLTLEAGDCDDQAYVVTVLALAAGLAARIAPMKNSAGEITHAVAVIDIHGKPTWAETTIDAVLGEHPLTAARRLGLPMREDITG